MQKIIIAFIITIITADLLIAAPRHIRVNQVGFLPGETKIANLFSNDNLSGATFSVIRISDNAEVFGPASIGNRIGNAYCNYTYHYKLDFSTFTTPGTYKIVLNATTSAESYPFTIDNCVYSTKQETILNFFRAQRCGFNPYLNVSCHTATNTRKDAKAVGGPNPGAVYDAEGGWHDAGDYIKFMINDAAATFMLLFAYKENPSVFADNYLANGLTGSNGIPDVLDEAKYGLDWIIKMHPNTNEFYYQVGDGVDHNQWRLPQNDSVNGYSTTPYRPMYHCDSGKGANVAGKAAAALALAYIIWNGLGDTTYANACLTHAEQIYSFGKSRMSAQPSTDGFYDETTYYDDMELAAAELYKATGNSSYLTDAQNYAQQADSAWGWTDWGTLNFYAHYELYPQVGASFKNTLKGYMQSDLNSGFSSLDVFGMNTTQYIWGSMALLTANILNAYLYKKLFPTETTYDNAATFARDYVLGKNQWSVCFIVGLGSDYPDDPHHQIARINNVDIFGMPIEGPVTQANWNSYGGTAPSTDPYAAFQSSQAIYYDYWEDYSTNEPTIWQTGITLAMFTLLSQQNCFVSTPTNTPTASLTFSPSKTPTFTLTPTRTNTITATFTNSSTRTRTPTFTATNKLTSSQTYTPSITQTFTGTRTFPATNTYTHTATLTLTNTNTNTPTSTQTTTYTNTQTKTLTEIITGTQTPTWTPSLTPSVIPSVTFTSTSQSTFTATNTSTRTYTRTSTSTATFTSTESPTFTATVSLTLTFTTSVTSTFTNTSTATGTSTVIFTPTRTNTHIPTASFTPTPKSDEELKVEIENFYPNPVIKGSDLIIKLKINKSVEEIKIRIYTVALRLTGEIDAEINLDNTVKIKGEEIKDLANGVYYYMISIKDENGKQWTTKIKSFIIIK